MPSDRPIRLGALEVAVPAPAATAAFLAEALWFVTRANGESWHVTTGGEYGMPAPSRVLTLVPGTELALREIVFDVDAEFDVGGLVGRLAARGMPKAAEVPADACGGPGLRFVDPSGLSVAVRATGPPLADALPPAPLRPRRLGHVNILASDPAEAADFYTAVLGLRRSEQIGDGFHFLRVGSEHHNLGIRGGSRPPGVHHVGFEAHGWDSYRPVCDHLAALGHRVEYGPGRHGPGNNTFVYLRDPSSGLRLELYADMAHIHDEQGYQPKRWNPEDRLSTTVNRWGPPPPESFLS